jgi:transcriptional regulator with XRE-family HTH domain
MPTFNHRLLRQWRDDSGMKPEEVAYRANCSFSHLLRLESLGGNPSADLLTRIAAVYGRDVRELFTADPDALDARLARRRAS